MAPGTPSCASYRVAGAFADLVVVADGSGTVQWSIPQHFAFVGRWDVDTYVDGTATGSSFHQIVNQPVTVYGRVVAEHHQIFEIRATASTQDGVLTEQELPKRLLRAVMTAAWCHATRTRSTAGSKRSSPPSMVLSSSSNSRNGFEPVAGLSAH